MSRVIRWHRVVKVDWRGLGVGNLVTRILWGRIRRARSRIGLVFGDTDEQLDGDERIRLASTAFRTVGFMSRWIKPDGGSTG
jgi:hypothetical protein